MCLCTCNDAKLPFVFSAHGHAYETQVLLYYWRVNFLLSFFWHTLNCPPSILPKLFCLFIIQTSSSGDESTIHQKPEKEEPLFPGTQKQTTSENSDMDMQHPPPPKTPQWQHDHSKQLVVIVSGIVCRNRVYIFQLLFLLS